MQQTSLKITFEASIIDLHCVLITLAISPFQHDIVE